MSDDLLTRLGNGCNCGKCKLDLCCCAKMEEAKDRIEAQAGEIVGLKARLHMVLDREADTHCRHDAKVDALETEIEDLKKSLEIWIFHTQRAMGQKPDDARAYAKAWLFRNANGEEPE
jgi:hypothetical protein